MKDEEVIVYDFSVMYENEKMSNYFEGLTVLGKDLTAKKD